MRIETTGPAQIVCRISMAQVIFELTFPGPGSYSNSHFQGPAHFRTHNSRARLIFELTFPGPGSYSNSQFQGPLIFELTLAWPRSDLHWHCLVQVRSALTLQCPGQTRVAIAACGPERHRQCRPLVGTTLASAVCAVRRARAYHQFNTVWSE
jgi:hypothetical protein